MGEVKLKWEYGPFVQKARMQQGLTAEQLAEKISCSTRYVQALEQGTSRPGNATLFRLCEVLSLSADAFLHPEITRKDFIYLNLIQRLAVCDEATLIRMYSILHALQTAPDQLDFPPTPELNEEE